MSVEGSSESSTAVLFARVEPELKQELVERAREHDRSLSGEMRVLLRGALKAERQNPLERGGAVVETSGSLGGLEVSTSCAREGA